MEGQLNFYAAYNVKMQELELQQQIQVERQIKAQQAAMGAHTGKASAKTGMPPVATTARLRIRPSPTAQRRV